MFFIGNSLTDAMNYEGLEALVQSRGNTQTWARLMIPGAPLNLLWNARAESGFVKTPFGNPVNAFAVYTWDVLSLQPFDRPIESPDGDRVMSGNFYNLIKAKSPDCKLFVYAHWPRTPNNSSETACTREDYNTIWTGTNGYENRAFFESLTTTLRGDFPATAGNILMLPIGEVFHSLNNNPEFLAAAGMKSIWGVYSDGIHLKGMGSYITACLMYAMAYHDDPSGLGVPGIFGSVPEAALPYIHQTIKEVLVAKSAYTGISYFGAAPVQSVALNAAELELNLGKSATLAARFTPSNAANKAVRWTSSDGQVATVTNGVVTAKAAGRAKITATSADGGFQSVCAVTVTPAGTAVEGISLAKAESRMLVGASETLSAAVTPAGATNKKVIWSSSDPGIAAVSAGGVVTAVKKGTAVITATSLNGLHVASQTITATQPNHPPVAVLKLTPGNAGYAPYKVAFDGRSSRDDDPDDFVLGYDWVVKKRGAAANLKTEVSNGFEYNFTEAGVYEVTLQAVDNAGNLRSLNTETAVITVSEMPVVAAAEKAICYEGFDYLKAPITNFSGGRGWKGGWSVQDEVSNTVNDFAVADSAPVTTGNLRQSGNYMILGQGYSQIGRALDTSPGGPFAEYISQSGKIGKAGTSLWFSVVIRPQSKNKVCHISLAATQGTTWFTNDTRKVSFGGFGGDFWGCAFGSRENMAVSYSAVPLVDNTPALLVAKVDFGAPNKVTLYVNPAPGSAPAGTPVIATTTDALDFNTIGLHFGSGPNQMAADEIRIGASYADVVPKR